MTTENRNTVLITGGSGGIGRALVREAVAQGWRVLIGYRQNQAQAEALAAELNKDEKEALAWPVSLCLDELESIPLSCDRMASLVSSLDAVVLGASPPLDSASFLKTQSESIAMHLRVSAIGNQALLRELWKRFFRDQGTGHVMAILSEAMGSPPRPHLCAYIVGKRALEAMLECAVTELGTSGLRATAIRLGYTETPMLHSLHPHVLDAARQKTISGRFLDPRTVARQVVEDLNHPPEPGRLHTRVLE
jgi:NAD(P)-dependent dehydrogenase (short-subunit alcohol dehydrogenase family)